MQWLATSRTRLTAPALCFKRLGGSVGRRPGGARLLTVTCLLSALSARDRWSGCLVPWVDPDLFAEKSALHAGEHHGGGCHRADDEAT